MSAARRQLGLLLRNALRMDFRARGGRARRARSTQPFLWSLLFHLAMGAALGASVARADIPLHSKAALVYAVTGLLVLLNVLIEYQEILLAPADPDILGWRPIASSTLYAARVLHLLIYVAILATTLLVVPAAIVGGVVGGVLFFAGGFANALFAAAIVVLMQGVLLHRLTPERFQEVLGNIQILFMIAVVVGYQLLTPRVMGRALAPGSLGAWGLDAFPPGWFAAIATLGQAGPNRFAWIQLAPAAASLLLVGSLAVRRLAPAYQSELGAVHVVGSTPRAPAGRMAGLEHRMGNWLGARPLRRLGFEFFLAQMRGDRRIRVGTMPLVVLPVGLVIAALVLSGGQDPYASVTRGFGAGAGPFGTPSEVDVADADARSRAQFLLFWAAYMLSTSAVSVTRGIRQCNDWRGAWVFFVAPVRRYEEFYGGILWGIAYALLAPAVAVLAVLLLVVWRQPLHVAAHLVLPAGLAWLAFRTGHLAGFDPPFAREPMRHTQSRDTVLAVVAVLPLLAVAAAHYALRQHPWLLIAAGVTAAALGQLFWSVSAPRLRKIFPRTHFDG